MALSELVHSDTWKILQHNPRPKFDPGESVAVFLNSPQNWRESRVPGTLLGSEESCLRAALSSIASRLHVWKSLKSKSNNIHVEAKPWEYTVPVLPCAVECFSHPGLQIDLSRVCLRSGLSKTARKRGIRRILLYEDCWAMRVSEAVYFVHKLTLGELSCADQKLQIFSFLKRRVCLWGRRGL